MRHRVQGKKLARNTKQRKALFKGLAAALIMKGQIITTEAKAKAIKQIIDKLVSRAQKASLNSRRIIEAFFNKKPVTNRLVDELAPNMPRTGGYTRLTRLGKRRGDNTMMVKVQFVDDIPVKAPVKKAPKLVKPTTKKTTKKAKPKA